MMKRTILLCALLVATVRCATNPEVLDATRTLRATLDTYSEEIAKKAKEQRQLYDARATHLEQARTEMIETGIDQVRATRSIEAASNMASKPGGVRPGPVIRFLAETHAAEKARDAELRAAARDAESSLRAALAALDERKDELNGVKERLGKLSRKPSTRDELNAFVNFGKSVADELKKKQE